MARSRYRNSQDLSHCLMSKKRLAINIVSNVASFVVTFFVGFILTPYITKHVGKDAYGFIGLALNLTSYIGTATIAVNSMAGRFIAIHYHKQDFEQANDYYNSVLIINTLIAAALIVPCALVVVYVQDLFHVPARLVGDVQALFALTFAWFILGLCGTAFGIATFIANRLDLSSLRSIGASLIRFFVVGGLYLFFKPAVYYMGLAFALMALFEITVNIRLIKKLTPELKVNLKRFCSPCLKELFGAGIWNALIALGYIGGKGLDLLIANLYLGSAAMGTLAISKTVPKLIENLVGFMGSAFGPQFTRTIALDDGDALKGQVVHSISILGVLTNVPLVLMLALGEPFYRQWIPTENAKTLQVLSVISIFDLIFVGSLEGMFVLFRAANKIKVPSVAYLLSGLINLILVLAFLNIRYFQGVRIYLVAGVSTLIYTAVGLSFLPCYAHLLSGIGLSDIYRKVLRSSATCVFLSLLFGITVNRVGIDGWWPLVTAGIIITIVSLAVSTVVVLGRKQALTICRKTARSLYRLCMPY